MANYDQSILMRVAQEEGIDPALLNSVVMAESGGNPMAESPKGAGGLMQLMPATAQELGVTDVFDPEQNLRGGAKYLRQQLERFGDPSLALAAYNAGPANVDKYGGVPPFAETQNYIAKILGSQTMADVTQPTAAPTAASYDPMANLSKSQRMMLAFGALRDAGTALTGGQGNAFATTLASVQDQQKIGAQMQQRAKLNEYIQGLTGPTTTPSAFVDPTKPLGAPLVSATELAGTPSVATQTAPVADRSALQSQIAKLTAAAQVAATVDPVEGAKLSVQASELQAQLENMPTKRMLTPEENVALGLPKTSLYQQALDGGITEVFKEPLKTEAQERTVLYEEKSRKQLPILNQFEKALTNKMDTALESGSNIPIVGIATSAFQGEDYKLARNAGGIFMSGILRKDTGAAITDQEQAMAEKFYLPAPNDTPLILAAKKLARMQAVDALRSILPEGSELSRTEKNKLTEEEFSQALAFSQQNYENALKQLTDKQTQGGTPTPISQGSGPIVINGYTIEAIE
tara:strand:- start:1632 stop:3185 length:1554 start_codon:yes stop_codon:yes gene_type:complete